MRGRLRNARWLQQENPGTPEAAIVQVLDYTRNMTSATGGFAQLALILAALWAFGAGKAEAQPTSRAARLSAMGAALVQWTGGATSTKAILLAVAALCCEAAFTLLAVPLLTTIGAYGVTVWACALSVPMLGGWALLVDGPGAYRMPTTGEFLALAWLVLGVTLIAILSWFTAVHLLGAGLAGFFNGLMPVAAMAIGAATGTVALTPLRVIGTLIVAAGITLGMRASRAQPPKRYPTRRS